MLKKVFAILLAILLLVSPLVVRWLYFYEGWYQPPAEVARPDLAQIEEPLPETQPFTDHMTAATFGTVLVDLAHGNRVDMAELNVLQARLAARGQRLEAAPESDGLARQLRYAQALIIISPGEDWTPDEIRMVQGFVEKGGRLLLVTDPTRFNVLYNEWDEYVGLDYDAPHINDLATRFGLVFQADYLYNTVENEGNFRNIKLTDFADHTLTQGVDQLVFYAAHSIVSEQPALITAGGDTRSSTSERVEDLTVGLLAGDGAVLALGDLTFMTEPYNAVHDNDQFIANITDFLSGAQRQYELSDFPFFFDEQVDLIYAGNPLLDSGLLTGGSTLQALFAAEGKGLTVRTTEDDVHDTLFFGLYEQAEEVEPYLAAAQVSLFITPTSPITPSLQITATPTAELESQVGVEPASPGKNRIAIEPLGEMTLSGTSLLLLQTDGDRDVMVVLAHTEEGLQNALERLTAGDLDSCLLHEVEATVASLLALCPTEETVQEDLAGGWEEPTANGPEPSPTPSAPSTPVPSEPPSEPEGGILIIALDEGTARYDGMTSANDYAVILEERYEITTWSTTQEGPPDLSDLLDYDLVIWTAGDFENALSDEYSDLLFALMYEGIPVILSGAYAGDTETEAVQRDIQVADATHPLAEGFEAEEVIDFVIPPSGAEYEVGVLEGSEEGSIVFVRGPGSEASGSPSIAALEDEFSEFRLVFIGLPLYLLPEQPKSQLVLNSVSWLLGP